MGTFLMGLLDNVLFKNTKSTHMAQGMLFFLTFIYHFTLYKKRLCTLRYTAVLFLRKRKNYLAAR